MKFLKNQIIINRVLFNKKWLCHNDIKKLISKAAHIYIIKCLFYYNL